MLTDPRSLLAIEEGKRDLVWQDAEPETPETRKKYTNKTTINRLFGPRFLDSTFDNYSVYAGREQESALQTCRVFAQNLPRIRNTKRNTLILAGLSGTGKNHLAYAIGKQAVELDMEVIATPFLHIMQEIKASYTFKNRTERSIMDSYINTELLIIEEIGISFDTNAEKIHLFDLMDGRYKYSRPTIIITNFDEDAFKKFIDFDGYNRLWDRFQQTAIIVPFIWQSHRSVA